MQVHRRPPALCANAIPQLQRMSIPQSCSLMHMHTQLIAMASIASSMYNGSSLIAASEDEKHSGARADLLTTKGP